MSNQRGIERAKNAIKVHLLEIRLFKEDILVVVGATSRILLKNGLYLGHNMLPMLVMIVPMMTILFQLEAHYAHDPLPVGSVNLLTVELDGSRPGVPDTATGVAGSVHLEIPKGLSLDASGKATATVRVPPGSRKSLIGTRYYHAYVVWGSSIDYASTPVPLTLVQ